MNAEMEVLTEAVRITLKAELLDVTAELRAELLVQSRVHSKARRVSQWFRLVAKADLLAANPGYYKAETGDLRSRVPPGVIYIRWSSSGRFGKSRKEKFGPAILDPHQLRKALECSTTTPPLS